MEERGDEKQRPREGEDMQKGEPIQRKERGAREPWREHRDKDGEPRGMERTEGLKQVR